MAQSVQSKLSHLFHLLGVGVSGHHVVQCLHREQWE